MAKNPRSRQRKSRVGLSKDVSFQPRKVAAKILPAPGGRIIETGTHTRYAGGRFLVDVELDGLGLTITAKAKDGQTR